MDFFVILWSVLKEDFFVMALFALCLAPIAIMLITSMEYKSDKALVCGLFLLMFVIYMVYAYSNAKNDCKILKENGDVTSCTQYIELKERSRMAREKEEEKRRIEEKNQRKRARDSERYEELKKNLGLSGGEGEQ